MDDKLWQPLHIYTLEELRRTPKFCPVDEEVAIWSPKPADFILDLSDERQSASNLAKAKRLLKPSTRPSRGIYRTDLLDQLIFGSHHFHAFVDAYNRITCPGINNSRSRIEYYTHFQKKIPERKVPEIIKNENEFFINYSKISADGQIILKERVYFGTPIEPENWGMWLLQGIPMAWNFIKSGQNGRLLTWASKDFQKNLLSFLGVDVDKIINEGQWRTFYCKELCLTQYSSDHSLAVCPSDRLIYDEIVAKSKSNPQIICGEKIFVSRKSISLTYRTLLNEQELCDAMSELGFVIVEPEKLSFVEQVAIFNSARIVVGLGGAAMFNTVFCKPETIVISIESSLSFVDNHATLFASLGLSYGFIIGTKDPLDERDVHHRWQIDVPLVVSQIQHL